MGEATCREWTGSAWEDGNDIEASLGSMAISGTRDDCIYFGGYEDTVGVASYVNRTQVHNGETWNTPSSDMTRAQSGGGTGSSSTNAILPCGSTVGSNDATNQILDGTSWADGSDVGTNRTEYGSAGSSTDLIMSSGVGFSASDEIDTAEKLDGTTWSGITAVGIYTRYGASWGDGAEFYTTVGGIQYNSAYGSPTAHVVNRTPRHWDGSAWSNDTDTPSAGGTSGGKYNLNRNGATTGNSGTQGAVVCLGYNYTAPNSSSKQSSNWEATW